MYDTLKKINTRPNPFEFNTTSDLWTDAHTSKKMLAFHLNDEINASSRKTKFIEKSVEWITAHFNIKTGTKIVDFGCGPGLYTERLAQRHACVTGIDFSENSIQYAQNVAINKQLHINYVIQNYLEFETKDRFNLILMIMCDYCALSPIHRKQMLTKFYSILEQGGSVLLDVYSMIAFDQREEVAIYEENLLDGFWSPNKYYGFLNTFKYAKENVILDKYTIVEPDRTRTFYNWLQYFTVNALANEFEKCGFSVKQFYADVAGTPYNPETTEFAIVAEKI